MEEVIAGVLDAVAVQVLPPAASEVARISGTRLRLAVLEQLELALHRERIVGDEGFVVEPLTRDVDDAGGSCRPPGLAVVGRSGPTQPPIIPTAWG